MKTTCELMTSLALPSIRARIAKIAIEEHGMKQKDVAHRLGLTEAAVSQYLRKKRADPDTREGQLNHIKKMIDDTSRKLAEGELSDFDLMRAYCKMCLSLRSSQTLCEMHKIREPKLVKENCSICRVD
jgi:predicted transcriptional regulator